MALTDPLGDMLTRIRNGQRARKDSVVSPASKLRARVLDVLQREGYIRGYSEEEVAGHNGLRSIDAHVGNAFRRVRIGTGHPGVKELVHPYVLNDFAKAERPWVETMSSSLSCRRV